MEYHPHDTLAKLVLEKLARERESIPESEMRISIRGDVVLRPGTALPDWTGLLGELVGTGLTVLEFYHGRPRASDLIRARAKGALASALELERRSGFRGVRDCRVLVVMVGHPRAALRRAYPELGWTQVERGYHAMDGAPEHVHIDLLRLNVTLRTAWLHVAGNGPGMERALILLASEGEERVRRLLDELRQEVTFMPEMHKVLGDGMERSAGLRFLKAWESAMLMREGEQKGEARGEARGKVDGAVQEARRAVLLVAGARFGTAGEPLETLVAQAGDPACLEALLREAALVSTLEQLNLRAVELLEPPPAEQPSP